MRSARVDSSNERRRIVAEALGTALLVAAVIGSLEFAPVTWPGS
jgi:glycerol uptake facilitator-like aquaporin